MKKSKFVMVDLELDDDILLKLCLEAHKRDLTLNQFCNLILRLFMDKKELK